jgi:hypothetical protein
MFYFFLCTKAINLTRIEAVNVAVTKNFAAVKGPQPAVVFDKSGREGFPGPGNTGDKVRR